MRASNFMSSKYLSASDFGNQPTNWIITGVGSEIIGDAARKAGAASDSSGKPAGRGLVLNTTNLRTLSRAVGDEMEPWVGQTVRIGSIWVAFHGEQVRGIRVMPGVATLRAAGGSGHDGLEDEFIPY